MKLRDYLFTAFLFSVSAMFAGCAVLKGDSTERIDLSKGIIITVTHNETVILNDKTVPVDKVMEKLRAMQARPSDIIIIRVAPRASQRPVLKILDQLGDAKFNNVTITSAAPGG